MASHDCAKGRPRWQSDYGLFCLSFGCINVHQITVWEFKSKYSNAMDTEFLDQLGTSYIMSVIEALTKATLSH